LGQHPQISIPAACGGWAETLRAYRFFDNEKATFEGVLASHCAATLERMAACSVVLVVQDTTENNESLCLGPKGLGTLKNTETHERLLHPTVAFTPERICLGVIKVTYWSRDPLCPHTAKRDKGIDEKESGRWLESYQESCALQGQLPNTLIVNLADREGDIYEWFVEYADTHPKHVHNGLYGQPRTDAYKGTKKMRLTENDGKPWNKCLSWGTWMWK
jgi:hypothetical protein